jgi:hypothetical protein
VSVDVRHVWLGDPGRTLVELAFLGERVQVTNELLRVATGVAAFAGLYYAVTVLVDAAYRDQFVDALGNELRETFARRSEYHELLARSRRRIIRPRRIAPPIPDTRAWRLESRHGE